MKQKKLRLVFIITLFGILFFLAVFILKEIKADNRELYKQILENTNDMRDDSGQNDITEYTIKQNRPFVVVISKAIQKKDLDNMLKINNYEKSNGYDFTTGKAELSNQRTSSSYYDTERKFDYIRDIILDKIKQEFGHVYEAKQCEPIQLQKYNLKQFFKPHYDFFNVPGYETTSSNDRIATVIIYIKTAIKGGTTNFPELGLNIQANTGDLLYFTYDDDKTKTLTKHEGTPIEEGEKIIATLWIRKGEYIHGNI